MLSVHSTVQRQNYLGYIDSQQKLTRTGKKGQFVFSTKGSDFLIEQINIYHCSAFLGDKINIVFGRSSKKKNQSSDPHHCCCWRDPQKGASKGLREAFYSEYRSLEPSVTSLDGILVEPPALAMSNSPKYHQEKKYFWSVKAKFIECLY